MSDGGSAEPGGSGGTGGQHPAPSVQNLELGVPTVAARNSRAGDLVVFYFAGESRRVAKNQETQLDVRHYLLPEDADPGSSSDRLVARSGR